tara:strand:- start:1044 stop:1379 length:336 start_codon:yes stop_codon:yes gene_type:complete
MPDQPQYICEQCKKKESDHLQHELNQCQKLQKLKDQQIKKLDKKVFILMCIVVGVGAVFGKESIDSLLEWLETINSVKGQIEDMTAANIPGPGVLLVCAAAIPFAGRPRKK